MNITPAPAALRRWLEQRLLDFWFDRTPGPGRRILAKLLLPLAALTRFVSTSRRRTILAHKSRALSPPVIVVGNLLPGGTGKTPFVIAIVQALAAAGHRPGVLATGYRGRDPGPHEVRPDSSALQCGDEAVLLAHGTAVPVAAGRDRAAALRLLLAQHPDTTVIVSDDGLQHAGLTRSIELAVFDLRGVGNGHLLPAGPLREPLEHLDGMDAIVLNGQATVPRPHAHVFRFETQPLHWWQLSHPGNVLSPAEFTARHANRPSLALAGIARPERFFQTVIDLGLQPTTLALEDHARLDAAMLASVPGELVLMTEKDAVKLAGVTDDRCWVLALGARIDPALAPWLLEQLDGSETR